MMSDSKKTKTKARQSAAPEPERGPTGPMSVTLHANVIEEKMRAIGALAEAVRSLAKSLESVNVVNVVRNCSIKMEPGCTADAALLIRGQDNGTADLARLSRMGV